MFTHFQRTTAKTSSQHCELSTDKLILSIFHVNNISIVNRMFVVTRAITRGKKGGDDYWGPGFGGTPHNEYNI